MQGAIYAIGNVIFTVSRAVLVLAKFRQALAYTELLSHNGERDKLRDPLLPLGLVIFT